MTRKNLNSHKKNTFWHKKFNFHQECILTQKIIYTATTKTIYLGWKTQIDSKKLCSTKKMNWLKLFHSQKKWFDKKNSFWPRTKFDILFFWKIEDFIISWSRYYDNCIQMFLSVTYFRSRWVSGLFSGYFLSRDFFLPPSGFAIRCSTRVKPPSGHGADMG